MNYIFGVLAIIVSLYLLADVRKNWVSLDVYTRVRACGAAFMSLILGLGLIFNVINF